MAAESKTSRPDAFQPLTADVYVRKSAFEDVSDDELATHFILSHRPVTSEKNIWAYWHQGWDAMPAWRRRTVIDWARRQGPSWQIRVLDCVPGSPWHFAKWTSPDMYTKTMADADLHHGHAPQHLSDAVRLVTVIEHGGVFLDPGLCLFTDLEDLCWNELNDPSSPIETFAGIMGSDIGHDNFLQAFVAGHKGDPFFLAWHQIYCEVWGSSTSSVDLHKHPLLKGFFQWEWNELMKEFCGDGITADMFNDYVVHAHCAARLSRIEDPDPTKFNGQQYYRDHMKFINSLSIYPFHPLTCGFEFGCMEETLHRRLKLPYQAVVPSDEEQRLTRGMVAAFETIGLVQKLGSGIMTKPCMSKLWNANPDEDIEPGTWAEYLRWLRIHAVRHKKSELLRVDGWNMYKSQEGYRVGLLELVGPEHEKINFFKRRQQEQQQQQQREQQKEEQKTAEVSIRPVMSEVRAHA